MIYLDGGALGKEDIRNIETECRNNYFNQTAKWEHNTIDTTRYRVRLDAVFECADLFSAPSDCFGKPDRIRIAIRSDGVEDELTLQNIANDAANAARVIAKHVWLRRPPAELASMLEFIDSFEQALTDAGLSIWNASITPT